MNARTLSILGLAMLCVAGCDSRAPKTVAAITPVAVTNLREEAALLAGRGDHQAAEAKYREALKALPDDVELHFGLGSVLSQLDRRDEAAEEFRWVLANGRPGRAEVDAARRWLAEAGLGGTSTLQSTATAEPEATSSVTGKLTWPGIPAEKTFGIRIVVEGEGSRKIVKSQLNGTYTVDGLPYGEYKLTGLAGPVRVWSDLPVTISAGKPTTFDLSPANAIVSAAEFPPRASRP